MFNWGVFLFVCCGLQCAILHEMEKWFPMWCMPLLIIHYAFCFRLAIAGKHSDQSQPLIDLLKSSMEYAHALPNESDNCPPVEPWFVCCMKPILLHRTGEWSCSQYSESGLCVLDFFAAFRKEDSSTEILKASVWVLELTADPPVLEVAMSLDGLVCWSGIHFGASLWKYFFHRKILDWQPLRLKAIKSLSPYY